MYVYIMISYVSREINDPAAGITIRAIKFGQFLHKKKRSMMVVLKTLVAIRLA